jgi:Fe2+ or Zn2+ uptake regulation protein
MKPITSHDCKKELRDAELKVTPARLGVLAALESAKTPLDTASIIVYLQKKHVKADKVTVFRIMNTLTEKGLVKPVQFNEGKFRYEYGALADHHHFVCEKCGGIQDIFGCNIQSLESDLTKRKGVLVKRHSLELFGLCKACQK